MPFWRYWFIVHRADRCTPSSTILTRVDIENDGTESRVRPYHCLTARFAATTLWLAVAIVSTAANAATAPVGATPGSFDISNGAATYTIPIVGPPGTNGLAPALSLTYNSQRGNGLVGIGWGIGGLSVIHRCGATIAIDGFKGGVNHDANDRFCLDGEHLIDIGNGEYRSKHESWSKIIASGIAGSGAESFTVHTKDGRIMEYGVTTDSRIEAQGKSDVRVWALNRVEDRNGNYFTITYFEDNANGDYRPVQIYYTGNAAVAPDNSVVFVYEDRADVATLYQAGSIVISTKRLAGIETYAGTVLVRDYRLSYAETSLTNHSRLVGITECGTDNVCLPPTQFAWQQSEIGAHESLPSAFGSVAENQLSTASFAARVDDYNGDGISDVSAFWALPILPFRAMRTVIYGLYELRVLLLNGTTLLSPVVVRLRWNGLACPRLP